MSTEPLATRPVDTIGGSERGLLVAMLLMVVLGLVGMFLLSA